MKVFDWIKQKSKQVVAAIKSANKQSVHIKMRTPVDDIPAKRKVSSSDRVRANKRRWRIKMINRMSDPFIRKHYGLYLRPKMVRPVMPGDAG